MSESVSNKKKKNSRKPSIGKGVSGSVGKKRNKKTWRKQDHLSCFSRLQFELTTPGYSLQEPNNRLIDLKQSFAPDPILLTGSIRMLLLGFSIFILVYDLIEKYPEENRFIYLGWADNWVMVLSIFYQLVSYGICCLRGTLLEQSDRDDNDTPTLLLKIAWALYSIVAPAGILTTVIYWAYTYNETNEMYKLDVVSAMKHGGISLAILSDGLVIGLIPLRLPQVMNLVVTALIYLLWTLLHEYLQVGIGEWPANEDGENYLYPALQWRNDPFLAAIVSAALLFAACPAAFLITWVLSLYSPLCSLKGARRHLVNSSNKHKYSESRLEELADMSLY